MDEVKEYFNQHGKLWKSGDKYNFQMWNTARNLFLSTTGKKVGTVTCGGCRAKIFNWLMNVN